MTSLFINSFFGTVYQFIHKIFILNLFWSHSFKNLTLDYSSKQSITSFSNSSQSSFLNTSSKIRPWNILQNRPLYHFESLLNIQFGILLQKSDLRIFFKTLPSLKYGTLLHKSAHKLLLNWIWFIIQKRPYKFSTQWGSPLDTIISKRSHQTLL